MAGCLRPFGCMNIFRARSWSPYAVGVAIGVLSWLAFLWPDHPLGITTAYEHTAGLLVAAVTGGAPLDYFADNQPKIGWQWMLVLGVFLGAALSAKLGRDRSRMRVPPLWRRRFGPSVGKRFAAAFGGGALMVFGARLASGCTSGHGISGNLQLALSSLLFSATFAIVGVATAIALYGRGRQAASLAQEELS